MITVQGYIEAELRYLEQMYSSNPTLCLYLLERQYESGIVDDYTYEERKMYLKAPDWFVIDEIVAMMERAEWDLR